MTPNFENHSQVAVQYKHKAMAGEFVFLSYPQKNKSKDDVYKLFDQAALEVDRIENKFTEFRDSPLTHINNQAGLEPVQIDDEMLYLFQTAMNFSSETNGLFDISFASLAQPQRTARKKGKILSESEIQYYRSLINYKEIKIDSTKNTIHLPHKDQRVSFGGIGKGYAVDCAFNLLKEAGLVNFSVNGSGDMRVHSSKDAPRPWRLGIRNPFSKDPTKAAGLIQLANGALVTSGIYVQGAHIIKTASKDNNDLVSMTIIDESTLRADVFGTALMNLSTKKALDFLNQREMIGIGIDKKGISHLSKAAISHFSI